MVELAKTNRGKGFILLYEGYSYSHAHTKNKTRWYCSKRSTGCKAKVLTTPEGEFIKAIDRHIHPPPNMFRAQDGRVIRFA